MRKFAFRRTSSRRFLERLESELNEQQRAAVLAGDGPKLVIAGAGTGKTRTVTYRVAQLLDRGERPGAILLATFTNKAAREMLRRVEGLTGGSTRELQGGLHEISYRSIARPRPRHPHLGECRSALLAR